MPNPATSPPGTTQTPSSSGLNIPTIPIATDLNSALIAISVIASAINQLASAQFNNTSGSGGSSGGGGTFVQTQQETRPVVISDPNDASVQVEIDQVISLTLHNPVTNETWVWNLTS